MVSQLQFKQKIASTKSLQKIFSAQELIAASRITKARDLALASTPYAQAITEAIKQVATHSSIKHALTATRSELGKQQTNRVAVLCVTSDRGMAGAYSATIIRTTETLCNELTANGKTPVLYTSGRRAHSYYQYRGREIAGNWEGNSDAPTAERAQEISAKLVETFLSDDNIKAVDELLIVSTEFINMVSQKPKIVRMLPLAVQEHDDDYDIDGDDASGFEKHISKGNEEEHDILKNEETTTKKAGEVGPLYNFEPEEMTILNALLPRYVGSRIHACLLEAAASETASRQRAMHTATDNAKDLVEDLIRKSNKARQASITQELTEIVSSADALAEGGNDE
ncbi:ATP synthase gamma chain [Actinomycetota bacterium]|nr:ATP synthase gamma chain [Actinomycetota bacterium]